MVGYTDDKATVQRRLKRIEGQVRGLQRMVDDDTYCIERVHPDLRRYPGPAVRGAATPG